MDIPALLSSIVGSVFRHGLTSVGTYLVAHEWISEGDWTKLVAYIVLTVSGLLWSIYQKWQANKNPAPAV